MRLPLLAAGFAIALGMAARSDAESALRLPRPLSFGRIPAFTLDESGRRIGDAQVRVEALPNGGVALLSESRIDSGGGTRLTAELGPSPDGKSLVPLLEESHSENPQGDGIGTLRIDHRAGLLRCSSADGEISELKLPDEERVALAPMNLLFLPLVRNEAQEIAFQVAMCRGGPRLIDAVARRAGSADGLVEIRYELDFGPVLSSVVRPFLPRFSLWFDATAAGDWLAHRMPLYSKGPTVVVVRAGLAPARLGLTAIDTAP